MKKDTEDEAFIDISVGKIRLRIPDDPESILIAKRHIDALHKSFCDEIPKTSCETQRIEISTADEDAVETIEDIMDKPFQRLPEITERKEIQKLPVIEEQKEVKIENSVESYTFCPLCNGKLKKKGIKQYGNEIRQVVLCKNRKCKFQREYVFSI